MADLVIFISHNRQSFEKAKEIGEQLCMFGPGRILVHYSFVNVAANEWKKRVEQNLTDASWFILLYDEPQGDWSWCLYEAGFFMAKKEGQEEHRLFLLHKPEDAMPSSMQNFNSVPAMEAPLRELFRQIYADKPWEINPTLFRGSERLVDLPVRRIISALKWTKKPSKKIFIVHGHGGELKEATARLVSQLGLEPVILQEQSKEGRTIIENFSVQLYGKYGISNEKNGD